MPPRSPAGGAFVLRVRRLPGVLSPDAVRALLSHYGAASVLPQRRPDGVSSGREPGARGREQTQSAVARFASKEAQQRALQRLQGLELAGSVLEVVAEDAPEPGRAAATQSQSAGFQPPLPKGDPPPLPPPPPPPLPPAPGAASAAYAPEPLAPHLGLHFAPSPLLEYKYPRATETIVRNMANALLALPKLYTQVLHLMNKMNLPLPFEDDAIPGVFSADRADTKRARPAEAPSPSQFVEEEEEDGEEATNEDGATGLTISRPLAASASPPTRKRPRGDDAKVAAASQQRALEQSQRWTRRRRLGTAPRAVGDSSQLSRAFQVADDRSSEHAAPRPGVISEAEVRRRRRPSADMATDPAMDKYSRGAPSSSIRVRNVADAVDEEDLRSVFAFVLPPELDPMSITVVASARDRSATVSYPTEAMAAAAIDRLHGVVLEGHPLVVSFDPGPNASLEEGARAPNGPEPARLDADQPIWTAESLEARRLDCAALSAEKAMQNYARGERSSTLYVKNLAKSVQLDSLRLLFAATLPPSASPDELSIRHFTEGRMKFQAFVAFQSEEMAERALDKAHGVVLHGKPLVVCFRKQPAPCSAPTPPAATQL